jgi:hypothetical protein
MPFAADDVQTTVNLSDTAELYAYVYGNDDVPVASNLISGVSFTIQKPDGTRTTVPGQINSDGSGFLRYTDTTQKGLYLWVAQFTFTSGEKRSYRDEFQVVDPLEISPQSQVDQISEEVWMRIEDCFDSSLGGPWLRDKTLAYFDPSKIKQFIPEGLMMINVWPPETTIGLEYFTTPSPETDPVVIAQGITTKADPDRILIVQATLLAVIRHLMRSYVEQPAPQGANIVYQDRRDYLQRWEEIYKIEEEFFKYVLALWKRQFLNLGHGSLLIHSKAGRLYGPGYNRARSISRSLY